MARRLLLTYLTITVLTLAVIVVPLGRIFASREHDQLSLDIEHDAQAVAALVEDSLEAGATPSIAGLLDRYADSGGRIVVVDRDGLSTADSDARDAAPRDFSTRPEIAAALGGTRASGTRASKTLGTDLLYVAVPVTSGGAVHGAVRVSYPTSALDARVRSMWLRLGVLSLAVLGLVAVVAMAFASGVARPVRRLRAAAARLASGDLSVRVDAHDGPPELRDLADTFNVTASQLGQLLESQHRFVADASHQLRTPLTALRLRLETIRPFVAAPAADKLDAAIAETDRMARLVHSLLVLARADAARPAPELVDLSSAVAGRAEVWGPVASEGGHRLIVHDRPGTWASAAPGAVEQILDNLVSNALAVAPAGTAVTVAVAARGSEVELHVTDQGPGLEPEARAQAFERFWRRSGDGAGAGEGFGLGLAIVARLAEQSGGTARLDSGPGGVGLDATVRLPGAPAPGLVDGAEGRRRPTFA